MPTLEHIERVFASYAKAMTANDFAAAVALYAHDAVVRDPVDGAPLVGDEQILGFFSAGAGVLQDLTLTGRCGSPVTAVGLPRRCSLVSMLVRASRRSTRSTS